MSLIADAVVYAVGAGSGHAVRGSVISRLLLKLGIRSKVIVRQIPFNLAATERAADYVEATNSAAFTLLSKGSPLLLVDTFPAGWSGELTSQVLKRFSTRILVARYNCELNWRAVGENFTRSISPYSTAHDEWAGAASESTGADNSSSACGLLLRDDRPEWLQEGSDLLILDPERRLTQSFVRKVEQLANANGRRLRYVTTFEPSNVAGKFLFVGAGYNAFYETLRGSADAKFVAIGKRYDDQFSRTERCGRRVGAFSELSEWLQTEATIKPEVHESDCCESLAEYVS